MAVRPAPDADVVERLWVRIDGRPVAIHVLELGLACCGIEVREARRLAESAAAAFDDLSVDPDPATPADPDLIPSIDPDPATPADPGLSLDAAPADLPHVLVVAGTVTHALAPAVAAAYAQLPEPRYVLAFGACAATGGPYWDSYSVLPGAHLVVPVDGWVAGCPPRPADLVAGLAEVLRGAR